MTAALPVLALALLPATLQETWTQWRGPSRDGHVAPSPAWPDDLEDSLVERWRVEDLGPSYAGPIVAADRVFTVGTMDEAHEVVRAHDRRTGEELWTASWEGAMEVPFFAAKNGSWIRATPAYDGERLYVAGMRDHLVALDGETGDPVWDVDFVERHGTPLPSFGFVSSPLVVGDHLYVQAGASFCKLDKRTGEPVWRSLQDDGGMMDSSFSSPVLAELAGREQLLVQTRSHLTGVAPADGGVLWEVEIPTFRGMNILTPAVWGDAVFTSAYGGRGHLIGLNSEDGDVVAEPRWDSKAQAYMSSPVVVDGHAYLFLRSNRFTCVDLETGEQTWVSGPTGDEYWSLVAQGDRLLALANTGRLYLIAADPTEYRVLDELEVTSEDSWAHLAVAGDQVMVRSADSLVAFDWATRTAAAGH